MLFAPSRRCAPLFGEGLGSRAKPRAEGGARRRRSCSAFSGGRALAALNLLLAAAAGCTAAGPERPLSGQTIYERNCARCHGVDGRPTKESPSARDLSNASYLKTLSDDHLRAVIEGGRPPGMPAFGGQFMQPSLDLLIAYMRTLAEEPPPVHGSASAASDGKGAPVHP